MIVIMKKYIIIFNLIYKSLINAEFYSSFHKMKILIETQRKVIDNLEFCTKHENSGNKILLSYLHRFKTEHQTAIVDIPTYLENPVNSFRLIKRLTVDVNVIEKIFNGSSLLRRDQSVTYPTQEDLEGAAESLLRLVSIYDLKIEQLANGLLNTSYGKDRKSYVDKFNPMTISDCCELGKALFSNQYYSHGIKWLKEARNKKVNEFQAFPEDQAITLDVINGEINNGHKKINNLFKNFTIWFRPILYGMPNITEVNPNVIVELYKNGLNPLEAIEALKAKQSDEAFLRTSAREVNSTFAEISYNKICRDDVKNQQKMFEHRKCYLAHGPHPFLILAPVKAERLHLAPLVTLFHNAITDTEIQTLQDLAKPRLERRKVDSGYKYDYSNNRICQAGYIRLNESTVAARVRLRVSHLSGMDLVNSERLEVTNYGIGGHFSPHYDYFSNDTLTAQIGNRIATFLFYMTDVKQGGATVFPRLGLSVFPIKGAALFWTNLLPSGSGNPYTYHAACPVLQGSKWVATQWINLRGQELNQPCPLNGKK